DAQGALRLEPPSEGRFMRRLAARLSYWSDAQSAETFALTAAILKRTYEETVARGASALFVTPSYGPQRSKDDHAEPRTWARLFVGQGLPHLLVDVEPAERLPDDFHPGPAGARRIAEAIVRALSPSRGRLSAR